MRNAEQTRGNGDIAIPEIHESLLAMIVSERDDANTEALALGGSFARGTATHYSDIDIAHFVYVLPEHGRKLYTWRDGRMVNYAMKSLALEREALRRPERAIYAVPGFRDMRILLDKQGTLAAFIQDVQAFTWEPLQAAANSYASGTMMLETEFAYKILTALQQENDAALAYETMNLAGALTEIVAVQRGVLVPTNSTYWQQVWESVGRDSPWTRYHRLATGLDHSVTDWSPLTVRGLATLHLFVESVALLDAIVLPHHREVIAKTAQMVKDVLAAQYTLL